MYREHTSNWLLFGKLWSLQTSIVFFFKFLYHWNGRMVLLCYFCALESGTLQEIIDHCSENHENGEKVYPKMWMNRIMLIIEYMNAIYALKKLDNHFYSATSSFCIRILSSDICILYDIRLLVPWSGYSKVSWHCTLVHCSKVLSIRRGFRILC